MNENGNHRDGKSASEEVLGSKGLLSKCKVKKIHLEIALLTLLMAVVWGLLALPVVFYYRPTTAVSLH